MYIESPTYYRPRPDDGPAVFLAGGITACEDWQAVAAPEFARLRPDVVVLNPRRAVFDVGDPAASAAQIMWEFQHLRVADLTMFWFPSCDPTRTVQPITLFELGAALADPARRVVVGADDAYPRLADVLLQAGLARPGLVVHTTLADTIAAALAGLAKQRTLSAA